MQWTRRVPRNVSHDHQDEERVCLPLRRPRSALMQTAKLSASTTTSITGMHPKDVGPSPGYSVGICGGF